MALKMISYQRQTMEPLDFDDFRVEDKALSKGADKFYRLCKGDRKYYKIPHYNVKITHQAGAVQEAQAVQEGKMNLIQNESCLVIAVESQVK